LAVEGLVACALDTSDHVYCWASWTNYTARLALPGTFTQVSLGKRHNCALETDGAVQCWGWNQGGVLAPKPPAEAEQTVLTAPALLSARHGEMYERDANGRIYMHEVNRAVRLAGQFIAFDQGEMCRCGIHPNGEIDCFGDINGLPAHSGFVQVAVDNHRLPDRCGLNPEPNWTEECHVCAIDRSGEISCAGANDHGESRPPPGRFTSLAAGRDFTCAIRSDGALLCWGAGTTKTQSERAYRAPLRRGSFVELSIGLHQLCARHRDQTVSCWSMDPPLRALPDPCPWPADCGTNSPIGYKFRQISSGNRHNCGITTDGTVFCWGNNEYGQLNAPAGVFKSVVAGKYYSCGMRLDGAKECWGVGYTTQYRSGSRID
jgi:alpha-tubulin suppressor-like RCC1 family protein